MTARAPRAFSLQAHAKLNLQLHVGPLQGRLHQILSVFAELELHDTIHFAPHHASFRVECGALGIDESDNLALRAATALGVKLPPYQVTIEKHIPTQAGLGGGSSDAAATLLGLRTILEEQGTLISWQRVAEAATQTGSDVPSFLVPGLRVVSGSGERVIAAAVGDPPPWGILLLRPNVGSVTSDAYALLDARRLTRNLDGGMQALIEQLCEAYRRADFSSFAALLHNDFEPVIEQALPAVAHMRERLESSGATATILCGSGSCVAGFFPDRARAREACSQLALSTGEWAQVTGFSHG